MYTRKEELWNAGSHGFGIILSGLALITLMLADAGKTSFSTFSIILYGITLLMVYTASTTYHLTTSEKKKNIWKKLDHISIYFLIAGTYTPLTLIMLEQGSGWFIFSIVWSITLIGSIFKIFFTSTRDISAVLTYVIMGWLILFDLRDVITHTSSLGITLLFTGGAFYTLGVIFYMARKLPYHHLIWHIFVLGGSASHFFFILLDVVR